MQSEEKVPGLMHGSLLDLEDYTLLLLLLFHCCGGGRRGLFGVEQSTQAPAKGSFPMQSVGEFRA